MRVKFTLVLVVLSILTIAVGQVVASTVIALTNNSSVEWFDASGALVGSRALNTGAASGSNLVAMTLADYDTSNAGLELVVIRDDSGTTTQVIEVYSDPTVGSGALSPLGTTTINLTSTQTPRSIDIVDISPTNPGMEIVVLRAGTTLSYHDVPDEYGTTEARLEYQTIGKVGTTSYSRVAIAVGELYSDNSVMEIIAARDGSTWSDRYEYQGANDRVGAGYSMDDITWALEIADGGVMALSRPDLTTGVQEIYYRPYSGGTTLGDIVLDRTLSTTSTLVDFAVIPEPATIAILSFGSVFLWRRK